MGCLDDLWMLSQPEVVVGAEINQGLARHVNTNLLGSGNHAFGFKKALLAEPIEFLLQGNLVGTECHSLSPSLVRSGSVPAGNSWFQ